MIYFDHNASTPVRSEVRDAMREALASSGANPSSAHREGQRARALIEHARAQVAALVNASPAEVVFTSGGTEGDHLALMGGAWAAREHGRRVAISNLEHHAVHGAASWLGELGFAVDHLPALPSGVTGPPFIDALPQDVHVPARMLASTPTA